MAEAVSSNISDDRFHQEKQAQEIALAQMESRLRLMISELLQPTIARTSDIVSDVDVMKGAVAQHTRGLQEVQLGQFKAMEQVNTIHSFQDELGRWDVQRRLFEAGVDEKLEMAQQRMEGFRYSLEQKESALHHLHRSVDRVAAELNLTAEEQERQKQNFEDRIDEQSRKLNQAKSEIDVAIAGLELRHNALSDELWGEETGLARAIGEIKRLSAALETVEATVAGLGRDKAEKTQLDMLRTEVQKMLTESNMSVSAMRQAVGNVVNDVKEHFRTASQTIAAHNATFISEVRSQYQGELAEAAKLRREVQDVMEQMDSSIAGLDARVAQASERANAFASEAHAEIEELNKRRKREKTSFDNELKALKNRLGAVFDKNDLVQRGIQHIYSVMQMLLESDLMQCSMEMQDTIDRRKIALLGLKDDDTMLGRTTQSEPQRPRPECRAKSSNVLVNSKQQGLPRAGKGSLSARNPQEPVVRVDQRCLSCSGQAPLVLSAFKLACLQYAPSAVEHDGSQYDRGELLQQRHNLLQGAQVELIERAPRNVESRASEPHHDDVAQAGGSDALPLSEYAAAEARYRTTGRSPAPHNEAKKRHNVLDSIAQSPHLAALAAHSMPPRPVTVR